MSDYRPIALCNIYYNVISKILSLRLKPVLQEVISENQSAFVPGRAISDNVLITHEMLHYLKNSGATIHCSMAVKTDISKDYDRLEWSFVRAVLERMGFHHLFIHWMMKCITTVTYSFLVNDGVVGNVHPQRGIRQGDLLSPYLFILCGEALSGLCKRAQERGTLAGLKVARNSPNINHLLFADDTIFFTKTDPQCCTSLLTILHSYEQASGQMINSAKSSISFSAKTPQEIRQRVKAQLGIEKEGGVGKYLGLPEHFDRKRRDLFASIVDRIHQKAVSWSSRQLSTAGRTTMLQSVLSPIPSFAMTCFELPVGLCKRIQSKLTKFMWNSKEGERKICWTAWDKLTLPKQLGGLGFRDIQALNQALLAKVGWKIITKPDCLLARTLPGKYCHKNSFLKVTKPQNASYGWKSILLGRDLLIKHLGKVVGNGESTKVWMDSWIFPAQDIKPVGPILPQDQDLMVADLLSRETKEWNKSLVERLLPELAEHIYSIRPSTRGITDTYIWTKQQSGVYSVKSGYYSTQQEKIQSTTLLLDGNIWNWQKYIWTPNLLPKIKLFLWCCALNNLPTGENLRKRGLLGHTTCVKCGAEETIEHILFQCETAVKVWDLCPWYVPLDPRTCFSFKETLQASRLKITLPPIGTVTNLFPWICWGLWTNRNRLIFENKQFTPQEILSKAVSFISEWEKAQTSLGHQQRAHPPQLPIHLSSSTTIKCHTDAAWNKDSREAGIAWIFTDGEEREINRGCCYQQHVSSALMAEALAIREALGHAVTLDINIIWLRSDCKGLIQSITSNQ